MKVKEALVVLAVLTAVYFVGFIMGRSSADRPVEILPKPESGVLEGDDLQPVDVVAPDTLVFIVPVTGKSAEDGSRSRHNLANLAPKMPNETTGTIRPIQSGDDTLTMALTTARDWNLKRVYRKTLFDNEESGSLAVDATVQFNKLTRFEYDYRPATRPIIRDRVRPYLRGYIDTRGVYGGSVGALYRWFGADAGIIRYGGDKYAVGLGVMVVF